MTGYPGDLKFPGRMEVPRSTVTWNRELERRQAARQVEPRGMEELWSEGSVFINIKISISNIFAFSGCEGHLARSLGLYIYS